MADNSRRYLLYSYWDSNGDGIDQTYLETLKDSIIFDTYNRTIYSYEGVFGNHQLGTYHGEIFNDFDNNNAAGDYSSAHGTHVTTYNTGEAGFGSYNVSENGKTLLTVGNGTVEEPHNAFEIDKDGTTYVNGAAYINGAAHVSADAHINGTTYVGADAHIKGTTHVSGDSYVNGTAYVSGNSYVTGMTYVGADAHVAGSAYVSGNSYVTGTAYIEADAYINGNGHISGDSHVNGSAYVDKNAYVGGDAHINGSGYVNGDVEIEGVTYINADAYIGGRSVNDTFGRMISVMPINTAYNAYNGAHYIWMGSQEEYDSIAIKYRNVFYVVLEEAIDELPIYPQDINSPVVAAPVMMEEEEEEI